MAYVRGRNTTALGSPLGWIQAVPVVISTVQQIKGLFGGGASLADRITTRIAWTVQQAQGGSVLAAAIALSGSQRSDVDASERSGWAAVLSAIPAGTLALARDQYGSAGWWPVGQKDFYSDTAGPTHQQIVREVAAARGASGPTDVDTGTYSPGGSTYPPIVGLPAVRTVAPFNYTPLLIVGGFLAYKFLAPRSRR